MGFSGFPHAATEDAAIEMVAFIKAHTDIGVAHLDNGVPWTESSLGQDYPQEFLDSWAPELIAVPDEGPFYLAISPGRGGELQVHEKAAPLSAELEGKAYDDPLVIQAYQTFAQRAVEYFSPDYLALGIEVNEQYEHAPATWAAYAALHNAVYDLLKASYPDLPIFATLTLHNLLHDDAQVAAMDDIMDKNDLIAISYYPFLNTDTEAAESFEWLEQQFDHLGKPWVMAETNHAAEPTQIPGDGALIGSEEIQLAYHEFMLDYADTKEMPFVVFFIHRDYDDLWEQFGDLWPPFYIVWRDTGILDGAGNPRPTNQHWEEWFGYPLR
jgi:hypothetical protein